MTALSWQATIAISIALVFLLGSALLSMKRAIQVGLGMVLFWLAWTLGLSALFIDYTLSGPLKGFQLFLILVMGGVAIALVLAFNSWKGRNQKLLQENNALRSELAELETNLGAPAPPEGLSPSKVLRGTKAHRKEFTRLLSTADNRIVILSGWITEYGFNRSIRGVLEQAAQKGIRIYIGWGYRRKSDRATPKRQMNSAEESLFALAKKHPDHLLLAYFENHAKLLLVDSICIVGSFNWLSNAFSENDELSAALDDKKFVDEMYHSMVRSLKPHVSSWQA